MSFIPQSPPPLPPAPVSFSGERGAFVRLASRGAALELVTLGFYRFWLATDIRRHLWSNTAIDGDAAEYTGRGKELLIGFLFAMAILVPIYLAYFLISIEAERLKGFASIPLVVAFYAFGQFAIYRARRYRLTRTVWRGVRFWMDGSGWAYSGRSMLWALLCVLTLGLAWPWREAALERYKMQHSHYGDLQGSFDGRGWEFFKQAWWMWLCAPFVIVLLTTLTFLFRQVWWMGLYASFAIVSMFATVLIPALPFLYAHFKAVEWRWWLSGIRFGKVRLNSTLRSSALHGLYWKVIGWFVLLSIGSGIYFALCGYVAKRLSGASLAQIATSQAAVKVDIPLIVMMALGYIALILSLNVVMRLYLLRDQWARVLASVQVHGIEAVADITAKGDLASALGEGFADGLDVAGF